MRRELDSATAFKNRPLLERMIARVSPRWAFRRHNFTEALHSQRKYEAAEESRLRKIRKSQGSADATLMRSAEVLRFRARDLDENYDIASGVLDVLESKIVGSEILAHPMVMMQGGQELAVDLNRFLAELYREWAVRPETTRQHSLGKAQRLSARSWMRDGECFVHHLDGDVPNLVHSTAVPYSIELLEADMCPMSLTSRSIDDLLLRYGILTDEWGKPEEYLIRLHHPGDSLFGLFTAGTSLGVGVSLRDVVRVPARDISHIKHVKRMHQTRGVSALATVFNRLSDLKDYEESEQTAARIGSYVALAITKSPDAQPEAPGSSSPREMDWMPGMIFDDLVEGEEVKSIENTRPSNKIAQWRELCLKSVSSGTRAGYSSIARDFNGTYSAQRQELVESELHYAVMTEELVSQKVRPTYRRFVDMTHMASLIPGELLQGVDLSTLFKAAYRGPAVAYIDPVKEINHELIGVQGGFFSKQSVQLKRGSNPNDVDAEIEQERAREKKKGIVSTSNPANKSAPATAVLPAVDEDDDDAEAQDGNGNRYVQIAGRWVPQEMAAIAESLLE